MLSLNIKSSNRTVLGVIFYQQALQNEGPLVKLLFYLSLLIYQGLSLSICKRVSVRINRRHYLRNSQLFKSEQNTHSEMNKNVADYTNFEGKTIKKIVQAPGGASSFSLAWTNEKTDYGPERSSKKKDSYGSYHQDTYQGSSKSYANTSSFNYNEPIKVMEDVKNEGYAFSKTTAPSQHTTNYGGEFGYNQYVHHETSSYNKQSPQQNYYQKDSLDIKLNEQQKNRSSLPSQDQNHRACIKIHQQKSNISFGDNNYNYWNDKQEGRRVSNQSNRRPLYQQQAERIEPQKQPYPEKTSVKVHNPPGGRSNFTLG